MPNVSQKCGVDGKEMFSICAAFHFTAHTYLQSSFREKTPCLYIHIYVDLSVTGCRHANHANYLI